MDYKAEAIRLLGEKKSKCYILGVTDSESKHNLKIEGSNQMHSKAVEVVVGLLERIYILEQANKSANKLIEEEVNLKTKALERIEELEKAIKTGKCKHIAEDVLSGECSLCHLAWCELRIKVLEKGLKSTNDK